MFPDLASPNKKEVNESHKTNNKTHKGKQLKKKQKPFLI